MGTGRKYAKKSQTRPVKKTGEMKRRLKTQKRRLASMGVPVEAIEKLNTRQVKTMLKRPAKLKKA